MLENMNIDRKETHSIGGFPCRIRFELGNRIPKVCIRKCEVRIHTALVDGVCSLCVARVEHMNHSPFAAAQLYVSIGTFISNDLLI